MTITHGWKLFNLRKDGTIGPLFINRRQRIPSNQWLDAESHPTKGFAVRGQWHATSENQHHTSALKVEFGAEYSCKVSRQWTDQSRRVERGFGR